MWDGGCGMFNCGFLVSESLRGGTTKQLISCFWVIARRYDKATGFSVIARRYDEATGFLFLGHYEEVRRSNWFLISGSLREGTTKQLISNCGWWIAHYSLSLRAKRSNTIHFSLNTKHSALSTNLQIAECGLGIADVELWNGDLTHSLSHLIRPSGTFSSRRRASIPGDFL